jgi:hypothetical protein
VLWELKVAGVSVVRAVAAMYMASTATAVSSAAAARDTAKIRPPHFRSQNFPTLRIYNTVCGDFRPAGQPVMQLLNKLAQTAADVASVGQAWFVANALA